MTLDFLEILRADGVVQHPDATLTPLTGGVSSEIYRVQDGDESFVVKRALAKLNVADEWFADVSRNRYEVEYIRLAQRFVPDAMPAIRAVSEEHGYFAMEFLGDGFANWKELMMRGQLADAPAREAGRALGIIHRETWDDQSVRAQFETTENFRKLRTDPYLLTTGRRHPALEALFTAEVERIESTRRCLVHGDYSPKNMLFSGARLVILDCEVAWFGDPAFDVAFLLNHLFLKALRMPDQRQDFLALVQIAWTAYGRELGAERAAEVEATLPRLLLMLMLARVDGKSPVEYFRDNESAKDTIRRFVTAHLPAPPSHLSRLIASWEDALPRTAAKL